MASDEILWNMYFPWAFDPWSMGKETFGKKGGKGNSNKGGGKGTKGKSKGKDKGSIAKSGEGKGVVYDVFCQTPDCTGKAHNGHNPPYCCYWCGVPFIYERRGRSNVRDQQTNSRASSAGRKDKGQDKDKAESSTSSSESSLKLQKSLTDQGMSADQIKKIFADSGLTLPTPPQVPKTPLFDVKDYNSAVAKKNRLFKELQEKRDKCDRLYNQLEEAAEQAESLQTQAEEADKAVSNLVAKQIAESGAQSVAIGLDPTDNPIAENIFSSIADALQDRPDIPEDFKHGMQSSMYQLLQLYAKMTQAIAQVSREPQSPAGFDNPDGGFVYKDEEEAGINEMDYTSSNHPPVPEAGVFPDNILQHELPPVEPEDITEVPPAPAWSPGSSFPGIGAARLTSLRQRFCIPRETKARKTVVNQSPSSASAAAAPAAADSSD